MNGSRRFLPSIESLSWDDAAQACSTFLASVGAYHLAALSTLAELSLVSAAMGNNLLWPGAEDKAQDGQLAWSTAPGEAWTYPPSGGAPWSGGEPINGQACVTLAGNVLKSAPCSLAQRFVCEW